MTKEEVTKIPVTLTISKIKKHEPDVSDINVDVDELVRCKDCKHYDEEYCTRFGDDYGTDFYCGFAERRTDDKSI